MNDLTLYTGVGDLEWAGHFPVTPGLYACISPVYGRTEQSRSEVKVRVPSYTKVIQDSGAFSDSFYKRLCFSEALDRQLEHSEKWGYNVESVASYDLLIDEKWEGGKRYKSRWAIDEAEGAVKETIEAARFISKTPIPSKVLSAQGVSFEQYMRCSAEILEVFNTDKDIFGLGGWCIAGMRSTFIKPYFNAIMIELIPFLTENKVKKVHIWGVMDTRFLAPLLYLCDKAEIRLSTDSSGPALRPVKFGHWGYKEWTNKHYKVPENRFVAGLHQALHVEWTRDWLKDIRQSVYYKEPSDIPINLSVW